MVTEDECIGLGEAVVGQFRSPYLLFLVLPGKTTSSDIDGENTQVAAWHSVEGPAARRGDARCLVGVEGAGVAYDA